MKKTIYYFIGILSFCPISSIAQIEDENHVSIQETGEIIGWHETNEHWVVSMYDTTGQKLFSDSVELASEPQSTSREKNFVLRYPSKNSFFIAWAKTYYDDDLELDRTQIKYSDFTIDNGKLSNSSVVILDTISTKNSFMYMNSAEKILMTGRKSPPSSTLEMAAFSMENGVWSQIPSNIILDPGDSGNNLYEGDSLFVFPIIFNTGWNFRCNKFHISDSIREIETVMSNIGGFYGYYIRTISKNHIVLAGSSSGHNSLKMYHFNSKMEVINSREVYTPDFVYLTIGANGRIHAEFDGSAGTNYKLSTYKPDFSDDCTQELNNIGSRNRTIYPYKDSAVAYYYNHPSQGSFQWIRSCNFATAGNSVISKNEFKVYPNPFSDEIFFQNDELSKGSSLTIFDAKGKQVHHEDFYNSDNISKLDLKHLESGTYLIQLSGKVFSKTVRVFKE